MPELRKDPVTSRWVIIAKERAQRPVDFKIEAPQRKIARCPFCVGNEALTPPEIFAMRNNGSPSNGVDWRVRVIPNKFPALMIEGELDKRGDGMYDLMNGIGAHEVIVEHPDHLLSITELPDRHVGEVFWVYRERLLDLKRDKRFAYGLIFKNVGDRAGASLEHSHSQLIITPIVPLRVQTEIDGCKRYYNFRNRCLFCDMIKQEMQAGIRIVSETTNFISLEPFAPRFPFETWILPKRHHSHFTTIEDVMIGELASIVKNTLTRIEKAISNNPPYNYLIHTGPLNVESMDHYHWHFEIIPRITRVAGFEWGTGFYINPVPPENAAQYLREIKL